MFRFLRAGLGHTLGTKVGIALIGAVLVLGGGTAVAMASTHTALPFAAPLFQSGSPTAHSESDEGSKTPSATRTAGKDDQEDESCTSSATGTPSAQSDDGSDHESGTPSATSTATHGDDEANEHESSQDDQDECGTSKATGTPAPQSTEQPEEMQTPGPTPTKGPGGD
jgi:hypothetical protein